MHTGILSQIVAHKGAIRPATLGRHFHRVTWRPSMQHFSHITIVNNRNFIMSLRLGPKKIQSEAEWNNPTGNGTGAQLAAVTMADNSTLNSISCGHVWLSHSVQICPSTLTVEICNVPSSVLLPMIVVHSTGRHQFVILRSPGHFENHGLDLRALDPYTQRKQNGSVITS